MSNYRKKRNELKRRIEALDKELLHARHATEDEADEASGLYSQQVSDLENELNAIESWELQKKAARFGIDLTDGFGPWYTDAVKPRKWLEAKEQAKARRIISEARFEWWKKWVGLLSPIASVIIALLAVLMAGLALYFQLTGKLPRTASPGTTDQTQSIR